MRASNELANVIVEFIATYTSGSLTAFVDMVKALRLETKSDQPQIYNDFGKVDWQHQSGADYCAGCSPPSQGDD